MLNLRQFNQYPVNERGIVNNAYYISAKDLLQVENIKE